MFVPYKIKTVKNGGGLLPPFFRSLGEGAGFATAKTEGACHLENIVALLLVFSHHFGYAFHHRTALQASPSLPARSLLPPVSFEKCSQNTRNPYQPVTLSAFFLGTMRHRPLQFNQNYLFNFFAFISTFLLSIRL